MKILVVGKNNIMEWPQSVNNALRSLSFDTELFLFNKRNFTYCFMRLFGKKIRHKWLAKVFENKIRKTQPNLIFIVSAFFLPPELFNVLTKFPNIKKIGWVGDKFSTAQKQYANCLDILFCSDYGFLELAKQFKCKSAYLPLCADISLQINKKNTLPPLFVGGLNATRIKYLTAIQEKCLLYVKNCPQGQLQQHEVHRHTIPHSKMLELTAKSLCPINIGLSVNNITGLNFRVFEFSACGCLIMVNKECEDISRCYSVGTEAVVYDTPEDLNKLISDIVNNPLKYEQIAQAGYERTIKEHTYEKRMQQMFEMMKDIYKT